MKIETAKFISIWDLDGSDVIHDLDFGLTFGDGLTLHTVRDILDELRYENSARDLVNALNKVAQKFGDSFFLAF